MPRVAWSLTDNSTGSPDVYSFPINPNEFDPPNRRANVKEEMSVAANGNPVLFQGRDQVRRGSMSGVIRGADMYTDFEIWFTKWYPLQLTDDLGNSWFILIVDYTPKRIRRATEPNRYDYSVEFLVVG